MLKTWKGRLGLAALALAALSLWGLSTQLCLSAFFSHGVSLRRCPSGEIRPAVHLESRGLIRGGEGQVWVSVAGYYTTGAADQARSTSLGDFSAELFLVDGSTETPLAPTRKWNRHGDSRWAKVVLPKVNDGFYQLRAKMRSSAGEAVGNLELPLLAPARVHLLTDRPLYEPGNTVQFRAVVLRARDLIPLDGRPGMWTVTNPEGDVLLEEKAPAGEFGVVAGSFPLDRGAQSGQWTVSWSSGDARAEESFRVEPFTLPRFKVEAEPLQPFYRPGEIPKIRGAVRYSSGAPVAGASISLDWSTSGAWPAPTSWTDQSALPRQVTTDASGNFALQLPEVPHDLRGQNRLVARLAATDPAKDRVESTVSVLLSEDPISVSAVTELESGLVEGFNNRMFVRATTADGQVLGGTHLTIKRAWDPTDPGVNAAADEDGVASVQIDPGPAVNVVVPPMPFRAPPRLKLVEITSLRELASGKEPSLADQVALEKWEALLGHCALWVDSDPDVTVGLRVSGSGLVTTTATADSRLGRCVAQAVRGKTLPAGPERLYQWSLRFHDDDLPKIHPSLQASTGLYSEVSEAIQEAVKGARDCVSKTQSVRLAWALTFHLPAQSKRGTFDFIPDPYGSSFSGEILSCLRQRLTSFTVANEMREDQLGVAHLWVRGPARYESARPQASTFLGYEFIVTARRGDQELGSTKLTLTPGTVPHIRLRATPVLAKAGDTVEVEILRGPQFTGNLPEKLSLRLGAVSIEEKVDPASRSARFRLPESAEGWAEATWHGARTLVFVAPREQLSVAVTPDQDHYAPGQVAQLKVETRSGNRGTAAAVGLFGVDESLAQLAPLPGADELAEMRLQVESDSAFSGLDAQALAMGRVRGAQAAAAIIARVTHVPEPEALEVMVHASSSAEFSPVETLTDRFYVVLAELHAKTREWEKTAPADERMSPRTMATLWERAVDACEKRGETARDAYGRRLALKHLPADLLALTDPRAVVVAGTRLPEDVENWSHWVAKEMR